MDALPPDGLQFDDVIRNKKRSPPVTLNVFEVSAQDLSPLEIVHVISVAA